MLFAFNIVAQVLLVITSLLLILSILLHKGQGGGMSDMFGGGLTSAMSSSGVGQRNLNVATVVISLVWLFAIVLFAFTMTKPAAADPNDDVMNNLIQQQIPASSAPATPAPTGSTQGDAGTVTVSPSASAETPAQ